MAMLSLHQFKSLRRVLLPLLSRLNPGDIVIRHHYTGRRIRLHSFKHKGYWYHGRNRERATMDMFARLLRPGDRVFEVGGHIGYITIFFSYLVGPGGSVHVFEPGANNLPYIRHNTGDMSNIKLIEKAAGATDGTAEFFLEELTGQNNTLIRGYDVFEGNRRRAHVSTEYTSTEVEVMRLDTAVRLFDSRPDFVKVDVEGAELDVLHGMEDLLLRVRPALMVEVTRQEETTYDHLRSYGYVLFDESGGAIRSPSQLHGNAFALHPAVHSRILAGLCLC